MHIGCNSFIQSSSSPMYLPGHKPHPIDFYKEPTPVAVGVVDGDMVIDNHHQMIIGGDNSSGGEDGGGSHEVKAPKKRAETWIQEEIRTLIGLRREIDGYFNTSKSNKHLWDQISSKMREKGFDRSPTMCTDKWRNLLKEFKKVKYQDGGSGVAKMLYFKELEDLLRERAKNGDGVTYKTPIVAAAKVDSFVQFSDKGLEDGSIPYGVEASGRTTVNLDRPLDNDGDPLAITAAEAIVASGVPPWNWRETPVNGAESQSAYVGRVITVKWGEYTRRIGIDGTSDAIIETIKTAFGLRTKRSIWLEDEDNTIRTIDRNMPLRNYTLHVDEGVSIKICLYDGSDRMAVRTEDKTLFTEEEFQRFLAQRGLKGLRELNGYITFDHLDHLRPGAVYQAMRIHGD